MLRDAPLKPEAEYGSKSSVKQANLKEADIVLACSKSCLTFMTQFLPILSSRSTNGVREPLHGMLDVNIPSVKSDILRLWPRDWSKNAPPPTPTNSLTVSRIPVAFPLSPHFSQFSQLLTFPFRGTHRPQEDAFLLFRRRCNNYALLISGRREKP